MSPRRAPIKAPRVARQRGLWQPGPANPTFYAQCRTRCDAKALRPWFAPRKRPMNYLRTAILLAGLTALFMGVGYLIGGASGAVIAFFAAAAMNFISYWNADKLVLSMYGAHEVDARSAPDLYA